MKKLFTLILFYTFSVSALGQVMQEWSIIHDFSYSIYDNGRKVVTDNVGNIYVTGSSGDIFANFDFVTIKYNPLGITQWLRIYNGTANGSDNVSDMTKDKNGNIYVTGTSLGNGTSYDYLTIKYDTSGNQQWIARYNYNGNVLDNAAAITVDSLDYVYVTGTSNNDIVTIKYNSSGIEQWVARYDGLNNSDYGRLIAVDKYQNVYVAGRVYFNIVIIKYNAQGVQQWVRIYYNGNGGVPNSMVVDNNENVYIAGISVYNNAPEDFVILKYDSIGILQWEKIYDGPAHNFDGAFDIKIGKFGNVYATGSSDSIPLNRDIFTLKYNSSGNFQWQKRFINNSYGHEVAYSLELDSIENIYITGFISDSVSSLDGITLKYNSNGIQQWAVKYNGFNNRGDIFNDLTLDKFGNVIVTGATSLSETNQDFLTVKYSQYENNQSQIKMDTKLIIEGLYFQVFNQMTRKDTVTSYLHVSSSPYNIVDSAKAIIDSISFSGLFQFYNAPTDTYYIAVKHFNSIETWSKTNGEYLTNDGTLHNYNFTTSASQAYGNNLKRKGTKYCIYSGDINFDGVIDGSDAIRVHSDSFIFLTGNYLITDLNGDDVVDGSDYSIVDNNAFNFVVTISP